jgi:hypothetical protein
LRVVERGQYQPTLRIAHRLDDDAQIGAFIEALEKQGWAARDDNHGSVWVAVPSGVDARAILSKFGFVTAVESA